MLRQFGEGHRGARIGVKGGFVHKQWSVIFITSNYRIEDIYPKQVLKNDEYVKSIDY